MKCSDAMDVVMDKAVEYGLTVKNRSVCFSKDKVASSADAYRYASRMYAEDLDIYESFFCMALDRSGRAVGWLKVSQGGTSATAVDPKIVAHFAVALLASAIILVHNHPSGNLVPSCQDDALTKRIKQGLELLGVSVHDHLILSSSGYYSYSDNGRM